MAPSAVPTRSNTPTTPITAFRMLAILLRDDSLSARCLPNGARSSVAEGTVGRGKSNGRASRGICRPFAENLECRHRKNRERFSGLLLPVGTGWVNSFHFFPFRTLLTPFSCLQGQ
ncbi:MAG: hypothetical protein Kow0092_26570 [Deferrisomatales bacterium]